MLAGVYSTPTEYGPSYLDIGEEEGRARMRFTAYDGGLSSYSFAGDLVRWVINGEQMARYSLDVPYVDPFQGEYSAATDNGWEELVVSVKGRALSLKFISRDTHQTMTEKYTLSSNGDTLTQSVVVTGDFPYHDKTVYYRE